MTAKEILELWLKAHGYDGLYEEYGECACKLGDLCPCDASPEGCRPGYLSRPGPEDDPDCEWVISEQRPEERLRDMLKRAYPAVAASALARPDDAGPYQLLLDLSFELDVPLPESGPEKEKTT